MNTWRRCRRKCSNASESIGKKYGKLGGKISAESMTAAERSARAKKASLAAARKRTAERLERERKAQR